MFLLIDPDVADILDAVGVPGLHAHACFPDTAGFPTFEGVRAVAGSPYPADITMPTSFCWCHLILLFSSCFLRLWNLPSLCCWHPCCFWLSAIAGFTMMLAPSF
jgi:hypothetical protein